MTDERNKTSVSWSRIFLKAFYLHPVFEKAASIAYNYFYSILHVHVLVYVMLNVYPCFTRKVNLV